MHELQISKSLARPGLALATRSGMPQGRAAANDAPRRSREYDLDQADDPVSWDAYRRCENNPRLLHDLA